MTLAMKRLKNLGWLALVFMVAVLLYPLSLNVAALHSDLGRIDKEILETKQEISFLQAEIRTRASVAQLEEWNQLLYGYEPPRAEQFIDGERGLASLGGASDSVTPVLVAVDMPAGEISRSDAAAAIATDMGTASTKIREIQATRSSDKAQAEPDSSKARERATPPPTSKPQPESRTERLAKMDEKLLSDSLMREIQSRSARERARQ